ncbi:hypothetical protein L5515_004127 [Caenorhabditis briggsae]|uniref:non-specific serine/threonine protein kinase n=1 Tax=Caenorhabditis briggsae TaxID=6238 RepID=A0AAE9EJR6_CAEBR|nr:hypothetical protein L5515_004127 [Caenorhabditis briggsae]
MPLGLFSSGKAHVLSDEKPAGSKKKEPKQLSENKCKGVTLKLDHTRVTIEKQIAEGGFAIVYIACDRKNNKFALKRQFTKENQKQLDACCREHSFLKQCAGQKNIVEFVDSYVNCLGNGIWECMLLTEYHQRNVLQLMNERISQNQYLTNTEILSIFSDLCEAVSFIHHRPQPIIHRDLKVENVLISSHKSPNYILCDFGSATTQVLSIEKFGAEYVKSEIERNTTMCYRSPEMIDFYSGQVLGLKGDIWALGVLLYRLCYFCVPFEESPLAIQSVNYQFPALPNISDEAKALIYMLLDIDINRRPSIYQTASLVFEASRRNLPVEIQNKKFSDSTLSIRECVQLMKDGNKPRNKRESSPSCTETQLSSGLPQTVSQPVSAIPIVSSSVSGTGETSVAPRLRPKATNAVTNVPSISPVPPVVLPNLKFPSKTDESSDVHHRQSFSGEDQLNTRNQESAGPLSCPLVKPAELGFIDLDKPALPRDRAQTDGKRRIPQEANIIFQQQHRRNVSDTSQISRSAFKPYSSQQIISKSSTQVVRSVEDMSNHSAVSDSAEWNPFLAAPFSNNFKHGSESGFKMDDSHFGMVFDEIRRREVPAELDSDTSSIDSRDPFGAAPFDQLTVSTSSSTQPVSLPPAADEDDEQKLISDSDEEDRANSIEIIDIKKKESNNEDDSEIDEQRMNDRRRYSYENIDGVGDDASSDSRGKTDRDDSEEEEDDDSRRGGDTSHDEDSQNTVGSEDGEGGNRPLLEDDGLEDDDDHELMSSFSSNVSFPLFIGTSSPLTQNAITNPFLRDEMTPKMVSPLMLSAAPERNSSADDDWDLGDRWTDRRDTVFERPTSQNHNIFAPATLPRQVTPLVCRFKPELPTAAPVSIIPSLSNTSFLEAARVSEYSTLTEPQIGTLISVGAPSEPPPPIKKTEIVSFGETTECKTEDNAVFSVTSRKKEKIEKHLKKEKKKEKKEGKKEKIILEEYREKGSSDPETDGSEAEMWTTDGSTTLSKKKKKSTFGLRSSHPSIIANDLQFASPMPPAVKKLSKEKKSSMTGKNASFVNTSFQPEDHDDTNEM